MPRNPIPCRTPPPAFPALLVLMTLGTATMMAQAPRARADSLIAHVRSVDSLPSISVAVSRDGVIVYTNAVGLADLEQAVPATAATRYPIGSISKAITAVTALRLVSDGRMALDDPVQQHCTAFPVKPAPVTIGQLLAHTSGIRHYDYRRFDEDYLNTRRFTTLGDALGKFAADSLRHAPGTKYLYSSWGYVLLGCAIEGAAARPYIDAIRAAVLQPAGMPATDLDEVARIIPDRARSYYRPEAGGLLNAGLFDSSDRYPAGGLLSTPSDLVRFGAALAAGRLLPRPQLQQLWSEAALGIGGTTGHGLGWDLDSTGAAFVGGTSVGSTTFLYVAPDRRTVVALVVNLAIWSRNRLHLARQLAGVFGQ
jgi:CubicO group peptidase (beta-lactamase class C family)